MENKIIMLKTEQLEHHPDNPRKNIGDVTELSDSIKAKGILQNLTVVPNESGTYYVVIGNRRLEASKAAGLTELPCVISDMDYKTQIETMMVENIQREDLTVIEEAEGMQLMLDLGSSVEEISDKTGFSESTVRRRLKLNEYDKKKVTEAQDRGATLNDFVKLEQIKAKSERNKLLKVLGTSDFNLEFNRALKEQKNKELEKVIVKELETFAEPFPEDEDEWKNCWQNEYGLSYYFSEYKPGNNIPKDKDKQYFYRINRHCYNDDWYVNIYTKREVTQADNKPKKTEKEKETDRAVRRLNKIAKEHYELRKEFILNLSKCSKIKDYERICLKAIIAETIPYGYHSNNYAYNSLYKEYLNYDSYYNKEKLQQAYDENPAGTTVLIVYRMLEDSGEETCYYRNSTSVKFQKNEVLERIYDFLCALGYEMSTEEIEVTNGTYELYDKEN